MSHSCEEEEKEMLETTLDQNKLLIEEITKLTKDLTTGDVPTKEEVIKKYEKIKHRINYVISDLKEEL